MRSCSNAQVIGYPPRVIIVAILSEIAALCSRSWIFRRGRGSIISGWSAIFMNASIVSALSASSHLSSSCFVIVEHPFVFAFGTERLF